MARRLIVDTGVLVAAERQRRLVAAGIRPDDDFSIAAVTVAELRTGIELASELQRAARAEFLVGVLEALPVVPYDVQVAEAHGRLLAHVHREGRRRDAHDLIIAATALATDRIVLTTDRAARFDELPGVRAVLVEE